MHSMYKLIMMGMILIPYMHAAQPRNFLKKPEIFFRILGDGSNSFNNKVCKFPTKENRIAAIAGNDHVRQQKIVEQAMDTYPLIHQDVLAFLNNFLALKKQHGTEIEKKLYSSMNLDQFIMRLLECRPLMFMAPTDKYLLQNGMSGHGGFEKIGTSAEVEPLLLKNYLSYDEMAVAALIGMSTPTYFINNGARNNQGKRMLPGSFEEEGIYVGLVGARFEKGEYMEWQHMIITPQQNIKEKGYGLDACDKGLLAIWSDLYGFKFPTFEQAEKDSTQRFILLNNGFYFDTAVYKKRIQLVIEPFLHDAHNRAKAHNKKAYVHAVGLGLGVWQINRQQVDWMLDAYAQVIINNNLSEIADIDFSWLDDASEQEKNKLIELGKEKNMKIVFSKRNPADKLTDNNAGKLLVALYAWDGNAYPGNEYWFGMLTASGDPAAACCSTIAELQNPQINFYIKENIEKMIVGSQKKEVSTIKNSIQLPPTVSWWENLKRFFPDPIKQWWKKLW